MPKWDYLIEADDPLQRALGRASQRESQTLPSPLNPIVREGLTEADRDERRLERSQDINDKLRHLRMQMRTAPTSINLPFTPHTLDEWRSLIDFAREYDYDVFIVAPDRHPSYPIDDRMLGVRVIRLVDGIHYRQHAEVGFFYRYPDLPLRLGRQSANWRSINWNLSTLEKTLRLPRARIVLCAYVHGQRENLVTALGIDDLFPRTKEEMFPDRPEDITESDDSRIQRLLDIVNGTQGSAAELERLYHLVKRKGRSVRWGPWASPQNHIVRAVVDNISAMIDINPDFRWDAIPNVHQPLSDERVFWVVYNAAYNMNRTLELARSDELFGYDELKSHNRYLFSIGD